MALESETLCRTEWVELAEPPRRMKFRRDSTGYYERENGPGQRLVHENFLFKVEGGRLHLKFAHARSWTEVDASLDESAAGEVRIGARRLVLARDPYAWAMEERPTEALVLASDAGAALPS